MQLLKENLVGQELDGRPWAPGNKTKDILIADYRYRLAQRQLQTLQNVLPRQNCTPPSSSLAAPTP